MDKERDPGSVINFWWILFYYITPAAFLVQTRYNFFLEYIKMTPRKKKQSSKPPYNGEDDLKSHSSNDSISDKSETVGKQEKKRSSSFSKVSNHKTNVKKREGKREGKRRSSLPNTFPLIVDGIEFMMDDTPQQGSSVKDNKYKKKRKHADNDTAKLVEELASILLLPVGDDDGALFINGFDDETVASWPSIGAAKKPAVRKTKATRDLELKLSSQEKLIKEYIKEHALDYSNQDLRKQILLMEAPLHVKAMLLTKYDDINKSNGMSFGNSADKSKYQAWIKDILTVPFAKTKSLPVTINDGPDKIRDFLQGMKDTMNVAIAGHDHAKDEILDYVARVISNPTGKGNILALSGPKGGGKTRLLKRGVADALGRPFHVINLGGLNDVHVLTGHDMTYSGAKYGRIAQILIQSKCDNPIIYLDEIDKIQASSDKGMEIFRILTHILDEEQNMEFYDEYFGSVPLDLSKILFVASLNNPDDVEPILRDRLKIIHLNKLSHDEKMTIAYDYVLPELMTMINFGGQLIDIPNDIMRYIINVKTCSEDGCRQMKKNLETIVQKLNTMRITRTGYFENGDTRVVLGQTDVDQLLKHVELDDTSFKHMYI